MMGLKTRLAQARTLVWVGLQTSPDVLARLTGELADGRADVVVLIQPDAAANDLLIGHRAALGATGGRTILGIAADAKTAKKSGADLVAADAALPAVKAHQHALSLAVASDARELERALADESVDAVVLLPGLVPVAVRLAPPAAVTSKPWFVQVDTLAEGRSMIAAGARRLAMESPEITSAENLGMTPRQVVAAYRDALAASWRDDMEAVTFGGFAADSPKPGRPGFGARPLAAEQPAPQPSPQPDEHPDLPHREKGPDDHW